ncbi:MAG: DUF2029 domain-containing protein [Chitinophagaceae bacterium]|nr:DUF2029 domain-containing protein [Chitinophagaceae bacterium]
MANKLWIVACTICLAGVSCAIYRDTDLRKYSTQLDFRNRIAGARLQKDGLIPYMYEWKKGDELKYFDTYGDYSSQIGLITATPFFHTLLFPIADFKETTISKVWMVVQYIMLFGTILSAYSFGTSILQKRIVIAGGACFLFTEAWMNTIASGQMYLVIPFLFSLYMFCLRQKKDIYFFLAGLSAISLTFVRPNAVLIFLPFLPLLKNITFRQGIAFVIAPLLFLAYISGSNHQRNLWAKYKVTVSEHIKAHQNAQPAPVKSEVHKEIVSSTGRIFYSENGNFFVLVNKITGLRVSASFLFIVSLLIIIVLCTLFIKVNFKGNDSLYICGILGACLYMISDLFSPIYRHQYYTVQWFFALLLAMAGYQKRYIAIYIVLGVGLLLNIVNIPLMKMEHTVGEYIWLIALLILVFVYKPVLLPTGTDSLNQSVVQ